MVNLREHDTGERKLYDLVADPYQLKSLHASTEHQEILDGLRERLKMLKGCSGPACRAADGAARCLLATPTGLTVALSPSGVAPDRDGDLEEDPVGYNVYRARAEARPLPEGFFRTFRCEGFRDEKVGLRNQQRTISGS
jgi:hypothetical protein